MTDASPQPLPTDLLGNHGKALNRLARRLLGGGPEAEDAVQETWLRTLQHPPRDLGAGSGRRHAWLEKVLSNTARQQRRQSTRNRRREERAARADIDPASPLSLATRRETLRSITEAIASLEPRLQEVVFARYFDDLPAREIARQLGRPVQTIYRELDRARAALRERLRAELGEHRWQKGLAGLCGLPLATAGATTTASGVMSAAAVTSVAPTRLLAGGALMAVLTKKVLLATGLATGLSLVAVLVAVGAGADDDRATPQTGEITPGEALTASHPAAARPAAEPARAPLAAAESRSLLDLLPYEFHLELHVRDQDDLPARAATIWLAPERLDLNRAQTGDGGVLRLTWRGRRAEMAIVLASPADLTKGHRLRRLQMHAGTPLVTTLRVASNTFHVSGHVNIAIGLTRAAYAEGEVLEIVEEIDSGPPPIAIDDDGLAWFVAHDGSPIGGFEEEYSVTLGTIASNMVVEYAETGVFFDDSTEETAKANGAVAGRIRDARGALAENALVVASPDPALTNQRYLGRTNDKGEFKIENLPPGVYHVRAGGGDLGQARGTVEVAAGGEPAWWSADLDRGTELGGHLVDGQGEALVGWVVETSCASSPHWIDGAVTDEQGQFAIPNVESGTHLVRARPGSGSMFTWQRLGVIPGGAETMVVADAALHSAGELQLEVTRPGGKAAPLAMARVWLEEIGEGVLVDQLGRGNKKRLQAEHLRSGLYRVEVGAPGLIQRDLGHVHVTADGPPVDFGSVELTGTTILELPEGAVLDQDIEIMLLEPTVLRRAGVLTNEERKLWLRSGPAILPGSACREIELQPGNHVLELPGTQ